MKAFNIEIYNGTKQELLQEIVDTSEATFRYIVTPNINHVVQLEHNKELAAAYAEASHRTCDSRMLSHVLSVMRLKVREVIPGSTMTKDMIEKANDLAWRVTVIGSDPEEIETLRQRFPNITFQHHNPPMGFADRPHEMQACVDFVNEHPANIIVLAVGCPRQEILAHKILQGGQAVGVGLCVGASINFLSGKVERAPDWVQRLSMEWLHRICMEPRRLAKRYFHDAMMMLPIVLRQLR